MSDLLKQLGWRTEGEVRQALDGAQEPAQRWFLAYRDSRGLRSIEIYDESEGEIALREYAALENRCESANGRPDGTFDCCLFGADSLLTLCRTHASWFAPETINALALLPPSKTKENSGEEGR